MKNRVFCQTLSSGFDHPVVSAYLQLCIDSPSSEYNNIFPFIIDIIQDNQSKFFKVYHDIKALMQQYPPTENDSNRNHFYQTLFNAMLNTALNYGDDVNRKFYLEFFDDILINMPSQLLNDNFFKLNLNEDNESVFCNALHLAIELFLPMRHLKKIINKDGIDINLENSAGKTAFTMALERFIEAEREWNVDNADIDRDSLPNYYPRCYNIMFDRHNAYTNLLRTLIRQQKPLKYQNLREHSPLYWLLKIMDPELVKFLLKRQDITAILNHDNPEVHEILALAKTKEDDKIVSMINSKLPSIPSSSRAAISNGLWSARVENTTSGVTDSSKSEEQETPSSSHTPC